jgi:hypothetical protein
MASYAEVRCWSASPMHEAEDALKGRSDRLISLADELDIAGRTGHWVGDAGRSARRRHYELRDDLEDAVAQLAAVRRGVGDAGDRIGELMVEVSEAEDLASRFNVTILDDGRIVPVPGDDAMRASAASDLWGRIERIMRRADEIDQDLLRVLDRTRTGEIDGVATNLETADQLGTDQGALLHLDMLERYQVSPDPDGMTTWPRNIGERMTASEARMLSDLFGQALFNPNDVKAIRDESYDVANQVFDGQGHTDGHTDAFRHAYGSARLTHRFGAEWAADFTTAHERNPEVHATPVAMDLHNNEVGRRIAVENPNATPEELQGLIEQAVRDGEMLVIDENGHLRHSNEIPIGDTWTGGWPTHNPDRAEHRDPD